MLAGVVVRRRCRPPERRVAGRRLAGLLGPRRPLGWHGAVGRRGGLQPRQARDRAAGVWRLRARGHLRDRAALLRRRGLPARLLRRLRELAGLPPLPRRRRGTVQWAAVLGLGLGLGALCLGGGTGGRRGVGLGWGFAAGVVVVGGEEIGRCCHPVCPFPVKCQISKFSSGNQVPEGNRLVSSRTAIAIANDSPGANTDVPPARGWPGTGLTRIKPTSVLMMFTLTSV